MSMYTRCPHCETVFRVTTQQLQVSSGQVRCGKCQEVFDAFATLSSQLPASPDEPRSQQPEPGPAGQTAEPAVGGTPRPAAATPAPATREETPFETGSTGGVPPEELHDFAPLTLPDELFGTPTARTHRLGAWALGSIALLLALAGQATWFFPGELAARFPPASEALAAYCEALGCQFRLPRLPEQLFIEASDLQLLDPARPNEVLLTATMRNRAPLAQEFPMLELTLTNQVNQTAARKVFAPGEYLDRSVDSGRGLGANQEVSLRLYLDTGTIRPAGYRLYLFFS
jgi:predicted Zn finger-like uncharacterized protein